MNLPKDSSQFHCGEHVKVKYKDGYAVIDGIPTTIPEAEYQKIEKRTAVRIKIDELGEYVHSHLNQFPGIERKAAEYAKAHSA